MTGNPITPVVGSVYNAKTDTYKPVYGAINSDAQQRLPSAGPARREELAGALRQHRRLPGRAERATTGHNEEGRAYNFDYSQVGVISGLPLLPSLGVRGEL